MIRLIFLFLFTLIITQRASAQQPSSSTGTQLSAGDYQKINAPLPPVRIKNVHGPLISNADLHSNKNLLLMLFNPTCGHCEQQAKLIAEHPEVFEQTQILMAFSNRIDPKLGLGFQQQYATYNNNVLPVGVDSSQLIETLFLYQSLPQINIYNKEKQLIKVFSGLTPLDSIRAYLPK